MSPLATFTCRTPTADGCYRVAYRLGVHQQGAFLVTTGEIKDARLAAEMVVLYELLFRRGALGSDRISGKGVTISVSAGAIPKLIRGKSSKAHLTQIATPLIMQAADAEWSVSHDSSWVDEEVAAENLEINVDELRPLLKTRLGEIRMSLHAIERLCKRSQHQSLIEGWRILREILNSGRLRQVATNVGQDMRAAQRYGFSGDKFLDPQTGWMLVMRRQESKFDLLSAYAAKKNQRLKSMRPTIDPTKVGVQCSLN